MSEIIENQHLENNEVETINLNMEAKEIATEEINQTATQSETSSADTCCNEEQPKKKCCCNKCLTICNIILLLGLIGIYILHFTGIGAKNGLHNPNATSPVVVSKEGLKIAYIDSDSILAHYQYAKDMEADLLKYKNAKEKSYTQQMNQFQTDYQNYLKTGATLSLSQQQAKEAELKQRAEKLSTLEQDLMAQIAERQVSENTKLLNAIFGFVKEYNEANQKFDVILRKTFDNSPTMYMNPGMDITQEIIDGLNEEYKNVKANETK
ncbi:MAG: OmpH family outer membrane protein [Bacteroidales bacterium]|nr:OmpH family outer membrane protein [Candidatus Colimorpha pelethequi]